MSLLFLHRIVGVSLLLLTVNRFNFINKALLMHCSWVEMTDNTDISIRLNSSKHPQAPHWQSPARIWPTARKSIPSPQLVTTQSRPRALARSLVVSVLPVPAGPDYRYNNVFKYQPKLAMCRTDFPGTSSSEHIPIRAAISVSIALSWFYQRTDSIY